MKYIINATLTIISPIINYLFSVKLDTFIIIGEDNIHKLNNYSLENIFYCVFLNLIVGFYFINILVKFRVKYRFKKVFKILPKEK